MIIPVMHEENPFEEPEVAKLWITSVEGETAGARENFIYPLLQTWLKNPTIQTVLDIGAGQGVASAFAEGKNYFGVEPSQVLVERAQEKYPRNGTFIVGNAYALPFPNTSFDAAFSINVWFHLEHLALASSELSRILKPNAHFLIITPNPDAYATWKSFYEDVEVHEHKMIGKAHVPLVTLPRSIFYMHTDQEIIEHLEHAELHVFESSSFAPTKNKNVHLFKYYSGKKN